MLWPDSMARIDRETDKIIQKHSEALGQHTRTPERSSSAAEYKADQRQAQIDSAPESVNPAISDLSFMPADEARDVSQRLTDWDANRGGAIAPQQIMPMDLPEAFGQVQLTGREFLTAEEEYILAAIRLLIENHRWSPRLFNDTSVTVSGNGTEGDFRSALRIINELRVSQQLPFGGNVAARWIWDATEQLRHESTGRYRQSSRLVLDGNIPLLRGAGYVARENLIQTERNMIYAARTFERFRRQLLVDIANDYFRLIQTRDQIQNTLQQVEGFEQLLESTQAKVKAGRERQFRVNNVQNQLLSAQSSLANQREQYRLQLDRFKIRLGLSMDSDLDIQALELYLPEPEVTPEQATRFALDFRLDLQTRRDRILDSERGVSNAKNQLLPDLNLTGSVTVPTDPGAREGGFAIDPDELNYSAGVTFGLPLDRKIERLQLRQSQINLARARRDYERFRDTVVLEARAAVRSIDLTRLRLNLAQAQVEVTELRQQEQSIRDDVIPQTKIDTAIDLLRARNNRDQALTDLRNAILNYLLNSGQLRVSRDGKLLPLPGMVQNESQP